jgi:hypothetical protein
MSKKSKLQIAPYLAKAPEERSGLEKPAKKSRRSKNDPFFDVLRFPHHRLDANEIKNLFRLVNQSRVKRLAGLLADYITLNLPIAIERREGLADYKINPYVLLTCANVMTLEDGNLFASFLFNTKLYAGLETSFGKSIESTVVKDYPLHPATTCHWIDPPEKVAEFATYEGLSRQEKAQKRMSSVWREIDKSCVVGNRRYMTSIKSGPNCINDSQVQAMTRAIIDNHTQWLDATKRQYRNVKGLDIAIGITYGTDRTTNNKENQILVKLLGEGFVEEDRKNKPGVLIDKATRSVRVYRRIGIDFWAMIGNPSEPRKTLFIFLEILMSLTQALVQVMDKADLQTKINHRIATSIEGLRKLMFPRQVLPDWAVAGLSDMHLFWFATAMSAFYDDGL